MHVMVTGAAGFIGFQATCRSGSSPAATGSSGSTTSTTTTTPSLKEARLALLQIGGGILRSCGRTSPTAPRWPTSSRGSASTRGEPRGAGRGALFAGESARLRGCQRHGVPQHPGGGAASRGAPGVRVVELGVRGQHAAPVQREGFRRSSGVALRGDQAGQRADGAFVRAPLWRAGDGPAVLHGVRALGAAGHGALPLHEGDPRGRAHPGVQRGEDGARLHLHRRHRRGGGARDRPSGGSPIPRGRATRPLPRRARRRGASSTSATTTGWS